MPVRNKIFVLLVLLGFLFTSCAQSTQLGEFETSSEVSLAGSQVVMTGNMFVGEAEAHDDQTWFARKGMLEFQFDIRLTKSMDEVQNYSLEIRGRNIGDAEIGSESAWLASGEDRVELDYQNGYAEKSITMIFDGGNRAHPWMGASYIFLESPKSLFAKDEEVKMEITLVDGTVEVIGLGEVQRKNVMQFLDQHDPTIVESPQKTGLSRDEQR